MDLYNIHTHKVDLPTGEYKERCILSTSPGDFQEKRTDRTDIWYSCGIHPWYISDEESMAYQLRLLKEIVKEERVIAIGEAGLDKLQGPGIDIQIDVFRKHIELSMEIQRPLIIHCVKAWDELIALYKEYKPVVPWIIHGYRRNPQQTEQLGKMGFKFSIGERFNAESLKHIPLDSLFCETDMADISIYRVYEQIAAVYGMDLCQFATCVEENIDMYFKNMSK